MGDYRRSRMVLSNTTSNTKIRLIQFPHHTSPAFQVLSSHKGLVATITDSTDKGHFHYWEKFYWTTQVQKGGVLSCPAKLSTKRQAKGGAETDGNLLHNLPGWYPQHLHTCLIHTQEAPSGKGGNGVRVSYRSPPMQIKDQALLPRKKITGRRAALKEILFLLFLLCIWIQDK